MNYRPLPEYILQHMPLWLAAKNGKEDEVELVLSNGWGNILKDPEGRTALWWAVRNGQERIATLLLATGQFDVNEKPNGELGLLHAAVLFKHIGVAEVLLSQDGLDVNTKDTDPNKRTPLHLAAAQGMEEMVKILLAHPGIDVNSRDKSGETPLQAAAYNGYMEILVLLLARADIDLALRLSYGVTPLYLAAKNGHEELVDVLLDTPNSEAMLGIGQDEYGGSPLHAAAERGYRGVVRLLLAHNGTDPGSKDKNGATPLHLAAGNGHQDVVSELLATSDLGSMINSQDKRGETPLHRAASGGHEDCVIALMDRADVNIQDRMLRTPLHNAVQGDHHKVVEYLLKKPGILVHVSDEDLQTPLHLALLGGYESIERQLLEGSGFGETTNGTYKRALLSFATQTGNVPMLKLLLKRFDSSVVAAEINALDKNEQTFLWSAAKCRDDDVMEWLLKRDEVTLRLLVQRREASLVKVLLEAGYYVDTRDNLGRSALHIATLLGYFEIAKDLISFGAGVDCKDGRGNTALRLAIQRKRCDFIDMLLESSADITGVRTDEWLDAYGRKLPDAVHLEEKPSGKKTIRFIEAAVIPDIIRQMHNVPKTERRLM
jgi:ankyrin repeat protein